MADAAINALFEADDYIIRPCAKCCGIKIDEAADKLMLCNSCSQWYFDNEPVSTPDRKPITLQ